MASEKRADNVRLKLEWAKRHADTVKADIQRWADLPRKDLTAVTIGKKFDDQKGCFVFKVMQFEPLPIRWSLVVGDALYNFRAALEYLAWHLVRAGTEPKPRYPKSVQFPISANGEDFAKSIKTRLPGVKPAHLTIVERYQPYHPRNKRRFTPCLCSSNSAILTSTTNSRVPLSGISGSSKLRS
jgi:hypothetical protein